MLISKIPATFKTKYSGMVVFFMVSSEYEEIRLPNEIVFVLILYFIGAKMSR